MQREGKSIDCLLEGQQQGPYLTQHLLMMWKGKHIVLIKFDKDAALLGRVNLEGLEIQ